MADEEMLLRLREVLEKINIFKSRDDIDSILEKCGINVKSMDASHLELAIVDNLLTNEEAKCYYSFRAYKKEKDVEIMKNALDSLDVITGNVASLYDERKRVVTLINKVNEKMRILKLSFHNLPFIKIKTYFDRMNDAYNKYYRRAIRAGIDEASIGNKIEKIEQSNFVVRSLKKGKKKTLIQQLETSKSVATMEIDRERDAYSIASSEYFDFLRDVLRDFLKNDEIFKAMILTIDLLYGDQLDVVYYDDNLPNVSLEKNDDNINLIIDRFFEYYNSKVNDLIDRDFFVNCLEEFVLYFYNELIRKKEIEKEQKVLKIYEQFKKQRELMNGFSSYRGSLLPERSKWCGEISDTYSLVYNVKK